jgi:hypothetical protein
VLSYITSAQNLTQARILAVGKGPYEPLHRNNTARGRAMNRRIEIQFVQNQAEEGSLRLGTSKAPVFKIGTPEGK